MKQLLFSCLILLLLQACSTKKSSVKETIEKEISTKEEYHKVETNAAISDTIKKYLGEVKTSNPDCDQITKDYLERWLKDFNVSKSSGDNKYKFYYDEFQKAMILIVDQGETINELKSTIENTDKSTVQIEKEVVKVSYLPKWLQILAVVGVLAIIFVVYRISRIFIK